MLMRYVLAAVITLVAAPAMGDQQYSADQYDARIEVLDGGTIQIRETIALRFESGSFTQFFRSIPTQRTDGVEVVSASMDGQPLPRGNGAGQVEISERSPVRVTWHFQPTANSTHVFDLMYQLRGAVRQADGHDLVDLQILPAEHRYQVRATDVDLTVPAPPSMAPSLEVHRLGASGIQSNDRHIRITARDIRSNGWLHTRVHLPAGSAIDAPPAWQQRQVDIRKMTPTWMMVAAIVFAGGLVLLFFVHQQYDAPERNPSSASRHMTPPNTLPPAIVGALLTNGSPRLEHAMATLVSLADRGEIRIDEQARMLGQRRFAIARTPKHATLSAYEDALLEIVFQSTSDDGLVPLAKARNRLIRHFRKFKMAVEPALQSTGLLDEDRRAVRRRFVHIAVGCLVAAGAAALVIAPMVERFGPTPLFIALAFALVGIAALIFFAAHTSLSNEGLRRADEWRSYRAYLRDVARDREASPGDVVVRQMLPYAVALGLAHSWASYLKKHRAAAPAWFHAISAAGTDSSVAFSAFVAHGGAGANGGAHGAAGAAAGGGASGAS